MPAVGERRKGEGAGAKRLTALGVHIFAGGFSVGVERAGFKVLEHLEDGPYGTETAKMNWPDLPISIGDKTWREERYAGKVNFLYSNPPCAIFSSAGIATTRGKDAWKDDPRLGCWHRSMRVFEAVRPDVFALESVCQAYTKGREVVDSFTRRFLDAGYSAMHLLIDASWLGVPQIRRRFFLVAYKTGLAFFPSCSFEKRATIREALATADGVGELLPLDNDTRRFYHSLIPYAKPGDRIGKIFDELYPDAPRDHRGKITGRPSFTTCRLRMDQPMGAFIGDFYIHPEEDRYLGTEEMRAVCGYPPGWQNEGGRKAAASLFARAVMPGVAEWLARAARSAIESPAVPDAEQSVITMDLRKPPGAIDDITWQYGEGDGEETGRGHAPIPGGESITITPLEGLSREEQDSLPVLEWETEEEANGETSEVYLDEVHQDRDVDGGEDLRDHLPVTVEPAPSWESAPVVHEPAWTPPKVMAIRVPRIPVAASPPRPAFLQDSGRPSLLLTGSTPIQVGSDRVALGILTSMRAWAEGFRTMGYDVVWRPVACGEDVSGYDKVVVSLAKPNSIGSSHVHGALWTLSQRPDAVLAFDDWQASGIMSDLRTCVLKTERLFKFHGDRATGYQDVTEAMARRLAEGDWPYQSVVPVRAGGDMSLLRLPGPVTGIDPTCYCPRYEGDWKTVAKERKWVQASLLAKPAASSARWPVSYYGWRATSRGLGGMGDGAQERLKEPELMAIYARSWGVFSPPHPHAGSGWWRVRYLMAADAGCVLSACPKEAAVMGESYLEASDPAAVERMSVPALRGLAWRQAEELESGSMTRDDVDAAWSEVFSHASYRGA